MSSIQCFWREVSFTMKGKPISMAIFGIASMWKSQSDMLAAEMFQKKTVPFGTGKTGTKKELILKNGSQNFKRLLNFFPPFS